MKKVEEGMSEKREREINNERKKERSSMERESNHENTI